MIEYNIMIAKVALILLLAVSGECRDTLKSIFWLYSARRVMPVA